MIIVEIDVICSEIKQSLSQLKGDNLDSSIERIREVLFNLSLHSRQPVDFIRWVPIDKISANDYNPNTVANIEMQLLYVSIAHDGYTQPIVTIYDPDRDRYFIVDGFHRYYVMKTQKDIYDLNYGCLPVVVIDRSINDRMASTIRHNRARGKHTIQGMSNLVFRLLDNGWGDARICNELGMEPEELMRLKHITGFSKLFENTEYNRAWISRREIEAKKEGLNG
jgi:ParB-like chromosome segregation protein Spo0J